MASPYDWEELRKEARTLESDLDAKLVAYAKFGSQYESSSLLEATDASGDGGSAGAVAGAPPSKSSDTSSFLSQAEHVAAAMETEIDGLLVRLGKVNDSLSTRVQTGSNASVALSHTVQRHREVLADFQRDFRKTKSQITATREHAELLSSVRSDISSYRNNSSGGRMDQLLRERQQLHGASSITDDVLGQAAAAYDELGRQRTILNRVMPNVQGLAARFPRLQSMMTNIRRRKYKNKVILGAVIAICLIILIFYTVS